MIISTTQSLWLFDENTNDSAQNNNLSKSSVVNLQYGNRYYYDLINRQLIFQKTIYLTDSLFTSSAPFTLGNSGNETAIAFWYYSSVSVGFINKTTQQSYIVPLIASSNYSSDGISATPSYLQFKIEEVAHSKISNKLLLSLSSDGVSVASIHYSIPYTFGSWHHFVVNIKYGPGASETTVRIDVDNVIGPDFIIETSIYNTFSSLWLNKYVGPGNLSTVKQFSAGQLAELIVFSNYSGQERALRLFKYGYLFSCDSNYVWKRIDEIGFSQTHPLTISTRKIIDEGQSLFILRSNGDILKGERPIWDREFLYKKPEALKELNIIQTGESGSPEWSVDGVLLKGNIIRA